MENEKWQDFLPRGKRAELAKKHGLTRAAVTSILRREDVINYPELITEAMATAQKAMEMCRRHAAAGGKIQKHVVA